MSTYRQERPPSPPSPYRQRYYSPSRAVSRSPSPPPTRYDNRPQSPPRRYPSPVPRLPPPRRYDDLPRRPEDRYNIPSRRPSRSPPPRRLPSGSPPRRFEAREPPRGPRALDDRTQEGISGLAADREAARAARSPTRPNLSGGQWERGQDPEELLSRSGSVQDDRIRGPVPSREVEFIGLDPELREDDLAQYLRGEHRVSFDSIILRRESRMRQAARVRFSTVAGATEFLDLNAPFILMPALYEHSEPKKVKVEFATPLSEISRCLPPRPQPAAVAPVRFDGMRDIGQPGDGKRVLLLRELDHRVQGTEIIRRMAQEISKMMGRIGTEMEAEGAITRVIRIVDRRTRQGCGLAFVELVTTELATQLLSYLINPMTQPMGFTIIGVPAAPSFANPTSFVPHAAGLLGGEFLVRAARSGGVGSETIDQPDGKYCAYWNDQAGAMETAPPGMSVSEDGTLPAMKQSLRMYLGSLAGPPQAPTAAGTEMSNLSTQEGLQGMQPFRFGEGLSLKLPKKVAEEGIIPLTNPGMSVLDHDETGVEDKDTVLLSRTRGAHIVPNLAGSRKTAKNISKWNTKQSELAAPIAPTLDHAGPPRGVSMANSVMGVRQSSLTGPSKSPSVETTTPQPVPSVQESFDYSDLTTLATTGKVACLLCERRFGSEEMLRKHEAKSDLHKARPSLWIHSLASGRARKISSSGSMENGPKYRDRAAERREAFNQPAIPLPEGPRVQPKERKYAEAPKPPPPPPEPGRAPAEDEANKGNQLLAKMGWKAGTGLGVGGEGRVDPIAVQQFETRAGLGAAKGVDPTRSVTGRREDMAGIAR
ncbi:hypothetical protein M231_03895 [Tremella mesenterica]|uniref:G-patch domain-containing protein n=1 Tax=Tremella mesenterica TaxID=5217 RepID=A0A4Q1BM05_TREME|nr:hypothetical protein M231_03895 [Tremella mesenterica]